MALSSLPTVRVRGMGFALPGPDGICETREQFSRIIRDGTCCLTPFASDLPLKIAGQVRDWDPDQALGVPKRQAERYSRAAKLSIHAIQKAMDDASLSAADMSNDRTVLVFGSVQFAFQHVGRYFETYQRGGWEELGIGYWVAGTPASITSITCNILGLECPTLLLAGSCNVGARAMQAAYNLFRLDQVDRAIVVGADTSLDPIFLSGACYTSRQGFRVSTLSDDRSVVRPHDEQQDGSAPGEGSVAVILEKDGRIEPTKRTASPKIRLYFHSSRSNGRSPMAAGPPQNFSRDISAVLDEAGIGAYQVGFINSLCEGTRYIEDFFIEVLEHTRRRLNYRGRFLLTNQEAAFGHIAGPSATIKVLSNIIMMESGFVGPVVNCLEPYSKLTDDPVIGHSTTSNARYSLVVSGGASGDATSVLIERVPDEEEDHVHGKGS